MDESITEDIERNKYFRKFFLQKNKDIGFGSMEVPQTTLCEIKTIENIDFSSNWNYMIALIILIENVFKIEQIITHSNYVRFEFHNSEKSYQDKGSSKIEAFSNCIYHILTEEWDEKKPYEYDSGESYLK